MSQNHNHHHQKRKHRSGYYSIKFVAKISALLFVTVSIFSILAALFIGFILFLADNEAVQINHYKPSAISTSAYV